MEKEVASSPIESPKDSNTCPPYVKRTANDATGETKENRCTRGGTALRSAESHRWLRERVARDWFRPTLLLFSDKASS
jgi:hypothetical protein